MTFIVSAPPHSRAPSSTGSIMWLVAAALLLPAAAGVYYFGPAALGLIVFTVMIAVLTEAVFQKLAGRPNTIADGSAVVTGLLLALVLPPMLPLWIAAVGAIAAVGLVKLLFGGLGYNIFNPALAARAILLASWPVAMTTWVRPFDAVTTATPLYLVNKMHELAPGYWTLFLGNRAGSLGETCALAILLGAGILLTFGVIDWPAPAAMIGSV
ncbi:MAG TPA: RnfABCDGE type electron transport complex subunit D, partial [Candidatus Sulfotelmatobacter sp.]|nr:RnfABCDGE type electron transport complex subunit D [Candidatus Sulfotelmatobacter sp.]